MPEPLSCQRNLPIKVNIHLSIKNSYNEIHFSKNLSHPLTFFDMIKKPIILEQGGIYQ